MKISEKASRTHRRSFGRAAARFAGTAAVLTAGIMQTASLSHIKIGIDLQKNVCLGRLFIYRDPDFSEEERKAPPGASGLGERVLMQNDSGTTGNEDTGNGNREEDENNGDGGYMSRNRVVALKLKERWGIFSQNTILLKRVAAVPGDTVCRTVSGSYVIYTPQIISINPGKPHRFFRYSALKPKVPLKALRKESLRDSGCAEMGKDEYWISGDSADALDSRLLGPVKRSMIKAGPVFFMWR